MVVELLLFTSIMPVKTSVTCTLYSVIIPFWYCSGGGDQVQFKVRESLAQDNGAKGDKVGTEQQMILADKHYTKFKEIFQYLPS